VAPKTNQNISCVAFSSLLLDIPHTEQEATEHLEDLSEDCTLLLTAYLDQHTEVGNRFLNGRDTFFSDLSLDLIMCHGLDNDVPTVGVMFGGVVEHRAGEGSDVNGGNLRGRISAIEQRLAALEVNGSAERAELRGLIGDLRPILHELRERE
jgi:hypothetical protein